MRIDLARSVVGITVGLIASLNLVACGGSDATSDKPSVVASTNVWADIAATVAGPDADVSAIIADPGADPHSHETSAVESARISDADLVVYNGGHYDEFIDKLLAHRDKPAVEAVALRADDIADDENEHVWYDMDTVGLVAERIGAELGTLDPEHAAAYADRARALRDRLTAIGAITDKIAADHPRTPILQTEPLAHYLLRDADTVDRTPHDYQEAIEQETDPSPASIAAIRDLITAKRVRILVYNVQTEDPVSRGLRAAATAAGIPVVEVTETLPPDLDFVTWQKKNAEALAAAIG
ncbi:metal ABC transporter solute-binding protein, Zn/Mn family [Nocardia paucivorans]|uniref:metal ABC transporter solute-binding protein, Zn/Mn family n=1 Tax=Nocardia paucivorans TaxID=114259 RepID=UPI0002DC046B|nr:zinc ABC transporter substrate-binding protein [Nocardia paucivorans]